MAETQIDNPEAQVEVTEQAPESQPKVTSNPTNEPKGGYWWGTGRRKSSVARVRIKPGSGKFVVNKKELDDYFKREQDRSSVMAPLKAVKAEKLFDVFINVKGGGTTGQSGAALLGIARALKKYDDSYLPMLRDGGHLTREDKEAQGGNSSSRSVNLQIHFWMITIAAERQS